MTAMPVFWSICLSAVIGAVAAGQSPVPAGAGGGLDPFPGAHSLVVREETDVVVQPDGGFDETVRRRVRLVTQEGCKLYASERFSYYRPETDVSVAEVRVLKPDGKYAPAGEPSVTDAPLGSRDDSEAVNPDFRVKTVQYPSLSPQDILETTVVRKVRPRVARGFSDRYLFQYATPVLYKQVQIRVPVDMAIRYSVKGGGVEHEQSSVKGGVVHRWWSVMASPVSVEPEMPSMPGVAARLLVSTFPSWKDVSRAAYLSGHVWSDDDDLLKRTVRGVTSGLSSTRGRVLAIYRFVAGEVRLLPGTLEIGLFNTPRPSSVVLSAKRGTVREKSALLSLMLGEIGLEVEEALVDLTHETDSDIPVGIFERSICVVKNKELGTLYLDPCTEVNASLGDPYVGDRLILPVTAAGSTLVHTPPASPERSGGEIRVTSRFSPGGDLESRVEYTGSGYYEQILRTMVRGLPENRLVTLFQTLAEALSTQVKVDDLRITSWKDLTAMFKLSFNISAKRPGVVAGGYLLLKTPLLSTRVDLFMDGLLSLAAAPGRSQPICIVSPVMSTSEEVVELPAGSRVLSLPDPVSVEAGPVRLQLSCLAEGGVVRLKGVFSCGVHTLAPGDFPALAKAFDGLRKFRKSWLIVSRPPQEETEQ